MNNERWPRLVEIFEGALAEPVESRDAWVREACGDDAELLRQAEALLHAHETAGGFLEEPPRFDPADLDALPEGTALGDYRIVREIGRGGMGVVHLALDNMDREVVLKTLPPLLSANDQLRERLRREALASARINHPAVAGVHALAEIEGHVIVVSEYVQGDTLRSILDLGPVEPAQAHAIAVDIAGALAAAHAARIIHRDLKPENIIVMPSGHAKVVDFGIAHIDIGEPSRLTVPGMAIGTPAYMAPEQLRGGVVTPRSDVYSFGIVFREMLTGRHPATPGPADLIPQKFADIIARCVSHDPDERYPSGQELLTALTGDAAVAPGAGDRTIPGSPRWWWEFHQAAAAAAYWVMTWPAWIGREIVGGRTGRALFIATLVAVIIAANLRLHLWFTSRFYPAELRWARRREGPWIRLADWLFVGSLAATGILVGEDRSPIAIVLIAVAVGTAIAFLIIERATARAAFRNSATPRP